MTKRLLRCALAIAAGFSALALDDHEARLPSLTTAEAYIGNPLTPMSYAGVARRTTRRAAYAGAYAAPPPAYAAPPPAYAAAPPARTCVQTTDAYGNVSSTC
jgi:hypothetical protein